MKKLICYLFGHRYKVTSRITRNIAELRCPRCGAMFGINTQTQSLLPLDADLKEAHRVIKGGIYK